MRLEEEHQLQLEEDDRIDRWPSDAGVGAADQVANKR
jgi:hypothetical protein